MNIFIKKGSLTPEEIQIKRLKEELKHCEKMMKRTEMLFDLTTDENLIEARIYEMKSLAKHHDYLLSELRNLMFTEEKTVLNV